MIQLTAIDLAIDVPKMLTETEQAIVELTKAGIDVPSEAHAMLGLLRRCAVAEEKVAELYAELASQ